MVKHVSGRAVYLAVERTGKGFVSHSSRERVSQMVICGNLGPGGSRGAQVYVSFVMYIDKGGRDIVLFFPFLVTFFFFFCAFCVFSSPPSPHLPLFFFFSLFFILLGSLVYRIFWNGI